jgi:hypothetical protein
MVEKEKEEEEVVVWKSINKKSRTETFLFD